MASVVLSSSYNETDELIRYFRERDAELEEEHETVWFEHSSYYFNVIFSL